MDLMILGITRPAVSNAHRGIPHCAGRKGGEEMAVFSPSFFRVRSVIVQSRWRGGAVRLPATPLSIRQGHRESPQWLLDVMSVLSNSIPPVGFTASQIALALGRSKRSLLIVLSQVPTKHIKLVRGQQAKAWEFCSLPATLQAELESAAFRKNYRGAETLLRDCEPPAPALQQPNLSGPSEINSPILGGR